MGDYLPTREADLVTWSATFGSGITAAPLPLGLTAAQCTAFNALQASFVASYNVTQNDGTRTPAAIVTKNHNKTLMTANIRTLAAIIQSCPTVTDTQRTALGLTVKAGRAPVPAPATAPVVKVVLTEGRMVRVKLSNVASDKRARPKGTRGAAVFTYVGTTPATDPAQWHFESNTNKTLIDLYFPDNLPGGAQVWITAFWFSPTSESGPAATPVSANLPGGAVLPTSMPLAEAA